MATIERHPHVDDYILSFSLRELAERNGAADLVEAGNVVLIRDYRLNFDFEALTKLSKSIDSVEDLTIRRKLKKLTATQFFEGEPPVRSKRRLIFADRIRQAIFDVLCQGDETTYQRAARALKLAHEEVLRIFGIAYPDYESFRFIPSLRITRTLFENLHWDNHSIDDDFHQARIFANLDVRPRIWHVSHRFTDYMRENYHALNLQRFAGRDPNEMLSFIHAEVLGGFSEWWKEALPKHRIAFDPGEVWLGESRFVSHQIYYGECAMVYMWFMQADQMVNAGNRFNERVAEIHAQMVTLPAETHCS